MATKSTMQQILGVPPAIDSSLQGVQTNAPHASVLASNTQPHDNGGTNPPANGNDGTEEPAQDGSNIVQKSEQKVNPTPAPTPPPAIDSSLQGVQTNAPHAVSSGQPQQSVPPQKSATQMQNGSEEEKPHLSYVEMFQRMSPFTPPTKEELERERKRQKREAIFSAIGDGVAALSNLYFTTKYAPNAYDPKQSLSGKAYERWEKLRKERQANSYQYLQGYMQAMKNDEEAARDKRNWRHQLEREGVQDEQWNKNFNENQRQYNERMKYQKERAAVEDSHWGQEFDYKKERAAVEDRHWEKSFNESRRQFNVTSAQNQQRINLESKRLAQEMNNNKNYVTFTLGNGQGSVNVSKERLNSSNISYVFNSLPENVRSSVHGDEIMTTQYGQKVGTGTYAPPTPEAMLIAIGANLESSPATQMRLQEIAGNGKKLGLQ